MEGVNTMKLTEEQVSKLAAQIACKVWEVSPIGSIGRQDLTGYIRGIIEAASKQEVVAPVGEGTGELGTPQYILDENPNIRRAEENWERKSSVSGPSEGAVVQAAINFFRYDGDVPDVDKMEALNTAVRALAQSAAGTSKQEGEGVGIGGEIFIRATFRGKSRMRDDRAVVEVNGVWVEIDPDDIRNQAEGVNAILKIAELQSGVVE